MSTQHCQTCGKATEHGWRKLLASTTPGSPGCRINERFVCVVCGTPPAPKADDYESGLTPILNDW